MEACCELAWAAGLFEGEGCFYLRREPNRRKYLGLDMSMTDRDVIERFARIVGAEDKVRKHHTPSAKARGYQVLWRWQCAGSTAERVATMLAPYLGERRLGRLNQILFQIYDEGRLIQDGRVLPRPLG